VTPPKQPSTPHVNGSAHLNTVSTTEPTDAVVVNDSQLTDDKESLEEYFKMHGIKSRPVEGGNWDVKNPLGWTEKFGSPSDAEIARLRKLACLKPGDEGYFDVSNIKVPGVTIVRTKEEAEIVLDKLQQADSDLFHACDTEVMEIDLNSVGPVGNGFVTCASVYSGPDFDYGLGDGPGSVLWIDNLDDSFDVLQVFKPWFENESHLKVWHNYGFDRHVMWNHGIDVKGFGGDTMHMARLQDTSRSRTSGSTGSGYSLEVLSEELLKGRKRPMKEIFGVKRLRKDGSEGTLVDIPPIEVMQRDPKHRVAWIKYSSYDAKATWRLRDALAKRLQRKPWFADLNLLDYYMEHMRPFAEVLTDMERRGIRVDARDYLAKVEEQARKDRAHHSYVFRKWAAEQIGPDGWALNTASSVQLQTFLFGGSRNSKTGEVTESVRLFKVPTEEIPEEAIEAYRLQEEELSGGKSEKSKCCM
jgi:DNA polymerase-1